MPVFDRDHRAICRSIRRSPACRFAPLLSPGRIATLVKPQF